MTIIITTIWIESLYVNYMATNKTANSYVVNVHCTM